MMDEVMALGVCAFCKHGTHDYPCDAWHEKKHDKQGYHLCAIDGGFRMNKPLCENMVMESSAVVGWV